MSTASTLALCIKARLTRNALHVAPRRRLRRTLPTTTTATAITTALSISGADRVCGFSWQRGFSFWAGSRLRVGRQTLFFANTRPALSSHCDRDSASRSVPFVPGRRLIYGAASPTLGARIPLASLSPHSRTRYRLSETRRIPTLVRCIRAAEG